MPNGASPQVLATTRREQSDPGGQNRENPERYGSRSAAPLLCTGSAVWMWVNGRGLTVRG